MKTVASHLVSAFAGAALMLVALEGWSLMNPPEPDEPYVVSKIVVASTGTTTRAQTPSPELREKRKEKRKETLKNLVKEREQKRKDKAKDRRENLTPDERAERLLKQQAEIDRKLQKYMDITGNELPEIEVDTGYPPEE